jgi:hypothetical protein
MQQPRIALLLCALYVFFIGCQSSKESSYLADDIHSYRDQKVSSVILKNGELYKYDKVGGRYIEERKDTATIKQIVGFDVSGIALNFEITRILEVQCQTMESDGGGTALTVILGAAGGILILALIFSLLLRGSSFSLL